MIAKAIADGLHWQFLDIKVTKYIEIITNTHKYN